MRLARWQAEGLTTRRENAVAQRVLRCNAGTAQSALQGWEHGNRLQRHSGAARDKRKISLPGLYPAAIYFFTVSGFGRKQREVTTCLLCEDRPQT